MLGKLLKYDFRSMWKQFSVIWPAALILAFLNRFTMFGMDNPGGSAFGEWMGVISMGLFGGVCFTMVILSAVFVLTRFYKGLLGDEGYLMHTLPVRSWQLVLSKLICALATTVVNGIVGILAMFLMMPLDWDEIFDTQLWQAVFHNLAQQPDTVLYFLEFLLLLLVMCAAMFMNFYLAMSIGHLFSRRRILMSVVAFFGLNILHSAQHGYDELALRDGSERSRGLLAGHSPASHPHRHHVPPHQLDPEAQAESGVTPCR